MAKREIVELTDDVDGSVIAAGAGETIEFSISGVDYTIDLKTKNAKELRRTFDRYIAHAERVGGRRRRTTAPVQGSAAATKSSTPSTKRDPEQTRAIRQWAADSGYDINDRGRIPASIEDAYNAAH